MCFLHIWQNVKITFRWNGFELICCVVLIQAQNYKHICQPVYLQLFHIDPRLASTDYTFELWLGRNNYILWWQNYESTASLSTKPERSNKNNKAIDILIRHRFDVYVISISNQCIFPEERLFSKFSTKAFKGNLLRFRLYMNWGRVASMSSLNRF